MIITQSNLNLTQVGYERSSLSIQQKQTFTQSTDQVENQRWALTSDSQYDYQNRTRSGMTAQSQFIQPNGQTRQYNMIQATQQLTAFQFAAQEAQIAIRQAFPTQQTGEAIQASGLAEFHFSQHIQFQQSTHNVMSAQGSVKLSDGREIGFNLHLEHQQNTRIEALTQLSLQKVAMQDPLVINLGDQPVSLKNTTFEFDLLASGEPQQLAQLASGAGYLTFDLNGDGLVSNGNELFGTQTGDAYAELAVYDEDGNGWIDENDSIFNQLKLWMDQTDNSATISLAQAGVGAIYLGNVPYEYDLRDNQGALLGQSKAASIVLMENGEVKTSQAIDLMPIVNADSVELIEDNPAFMQLQKMAEAFNVWQQAQIAWRAQFELNQPNAMSAQHPANATKPAENWFEQLHKQIEQMVAERRAFLDKLFGKTDQIKLAQA